VDQLEPEAFQLAHDDIGRENGGGSVPETPHPLVRASVLLCRAYISVELGKALFDCHFSLVVSAAQAVPKRHNAQIGLN
jgi:hypothetical protein